MPLKLSLSLNFTYKQNNILWDYYNFWGLSLFPKPPISNYGQGPSKLCSSRVQVRLRPALGTLTTLRLQQSMFSSLQFDRNPRISTRFTVWTLSRHLYSCFRTNHEHSGGAWGGGTDDIAIFVSRTFVVGVRKTFACLPPSPISHFVIRTLHKQLPPPKNFKRQCPLDFWYQNCVLYSVNFIELCSKKNI